MKNRTLFELPEERPPEGGKSDSSWSGRPRVVSANRRQVVIRCLALDSLIPEDHSARIVWAYVGGLDLSPVYEEIWAVEEDGGAETRREKSARERAARERKERVEKALSRLPEVEAKKKPSEKKKARVSTTDSDARVMKMPDGGYRPAVNVQFATDTESQVICGVDVVSSGGDKGQLLPMIEQLKNRYAEPPGEALVDGGFAKLSDIDKVSPPKGETIVYAPVLRKKNAIRDPHTPRPGESEAIAEWRRRMKTKEARKVYVVCLGSQPNARGLLGCSVIRGLKRP